MAPALLAAAAWMLAAPGHAQQAAPSVERVDPVRDSAAIPLRPDDRAPDREVWNRIFRGELVVRNVTHPTLTPVLPNPAMATGAAVIVIPGGGYQFVAMQNEGWPVARQLADRGIAAFVLKYRTNDTPDDDAAMAAKLAAVFGSIGKPGFVDPTEPRAVADAAAAMALVRERAAEWGVDPQRIGLLGFSAGARSALEIALAPAGARPAFVGYMYGAMREPELAIPADAPPMFAAIALDDGLRGRDGLGLVEAWDAADRPVELHAYERGDHGFGLGRAGTTTTGWLDQFTLWLRSRGLLDAGA
ncbi:dienelactone hydrolase family protein (plasmid) [Croceibacterium sp. TMG7-5b_MA50]|uniref:alpha/beta hydrolase n=1 Tax=Croceibacterium sp. TMG7-5b_MA50 TaxID=3121290 RepID=UPI003221CC04